MKILLLNQTFYPDKVATAQHTTDLALLLTQRGHQVYVITARRGYEEISTRFKSKEDFQGIKIQRVDTLGLGKGSFLRRILDALAFEFRLIFKLLVHPRVDMIVAFTSPPLIGLFAVLRKKITQEKVTQWLMDLNIETSEKIGLYKAGGGISISLRACFKKMLEHSDLIVALDLQMKEKLKTYGSFEEKVLIVPPWPVQPLVPPVFEDNLNNPLTKELGLQNKFVVLYSGNHSLLHPLTTVLQAAKLLEKETDVVFLFIGGGAGVEEVRKFKAKNSLAQVMQLPLQPREKLKWTLSLAGLHIVVMGPGMSGLVHVSKIYGVIATGLPFVCISDAESHLAQTLSKGFRGKWVPHNQPSELIKAINWAKNLSSTEKRIIAEENFSHLENLWSKEKILSPFFHRLEKFKEQK